MISVDSINKTVVPGTVFPLILRQPVGVKADVIVSMDVDEKMTKRHAGEFGKEQQLLAIIAQKAASAASSACQKAARDSNRDRFKCPDSESSTVGGKIVHHQLPHQQNAFIRNMLASGDSQTILPSATYGKPSTNSNNAPGFNKQNNNTFSTPLVHQRVQFPAQNKTQTLERSPKISSQTKQYGSLSNDAGNSLILPQQSTQHNLSASGSGGFGARSEERVPHPLTACAPSFKQVNAPAHSGGGGPRPALPASSFTPSKCFGENSPYRGGIDTATKKQSAANDLKRYIQSNRASPFGTFEIVEKVPSKILLLSSGSSTHSPANQTTSFIHSVSDGDQMDTSESVESGATFPVRKKRSANAGPLLGVAPTTQTVDQPKPFVPAFSGATSSPAVSHVPVAQRATCSSSASNNAPSGPRKSHRPHGLVHLTATDPPAPQTTVNLPRSTMTSKWVCPTTASARDVTMSSSPVTSLCTSEVTKPPSCASLLNEATREPSDMSSSTLGASEPSTTASTSAEGSSSPATAGHFGVHSGRQLRAQNKRIIQGFKAKSNPGLIELVVGESFTRNEYDFATKPDLNIRIKAVEPIGQVSKLAPVERSTEITRQFLIIDGLTCAHRCNTRQSDATRDSQMQHETVRCNTRQSDATRDSQMQHETVR
ncbi:hypothetical protein Btru_005148 [Bulinus truncatus]|nr:hypothetical protein Btru_005148 [Bulinus truncatus]